MGQQNLPTVTEGRDLLAKLGYTEGQAIWKALRTSFPYPSTPFLWPPLPKQIGTETEEKNGRELFQQT
jgi:hypothetical protein